MIRIELKRTHARLLEAVWRKVPTERRDEFKECFVCGRPVDVKRSGTRWIRVIHGGDGAAEPGEEIQQDSDLGCHPVGPECLRQQPMLRRVSFGSGEAMPEAPRPQKRARR
jgi:hypothetical protein